MPPDISRPLWIPLKREWFEAFRARQKRHEWRRYDARWNETSCQVGRRVTLSLGYSGAQLHGVIVAFARRKAVARAVVELYGAGTICAVIEIELD